MKKTKSREGFTIIEVVLVLAIAGLIFLMTFIALPTLRRQARDTQRREDFAQLASAIKKYQQNNRGALPSNTGVFSRGTSSDNTWSGLYHDYLKEGFADPSGNNYTLSVAECGNSIVTDADCNGIAAIQAAHFTGDGRIYIIRQSRCDGEKAVKSDNPRRLSILYNLESGGVFCLSN